ncbi:MULTISPECIES: hypothetical protein [unclassified Nocardiopsis]|uniref:hypothetical protein n=1 Tax=Nocardiopsis TaxID=2013 RepID=UPI00387AB411
MGRTEHHGGPEAEEGEDTGKKRIDLSLSQVAGAGAATLAAATAASYLNVYGTVIGAAVMATLSTVVSPFLQHWFSRGGDQARQLAEKAVGHTEPAGTGSHRTGTHPMDPPGTGPVPGLPPTGPIPGLPEEPDATRTMAMPVLGADALTEQGPSAGQAPGADATVRMSAVPEDFDDFDGPAGPADPDGPSDPDGAPGQDPARRGWRAYAVPAAVVFGLAMLVILLFELFTGRSLTAWTQGQDEPTSPTLFGGGTSGPPAQEGDGTDDTPADQGGQGRQQEDGTGEGTQDPADEPTPSDPSTPGTEPPTGNDGGQTDPTTPGDGGTTDPGEGQTDPGTGTGGSGSGGTEGSGSTGGTGGGASGGTENAVPEVPVG